MKERRLEADLRIMCFLIQVALLAAERRPGILLDIMLVR